MNADEILDKAADKAEQSQVVGVGQNFVDVIFEALKPMNPRIIQNPQTCKDLGKEI